MAASRFTCFLNAQNFVKRSSWRDLQIYSNFRCRHFSNSINCFSWKTPLSEELPFAPKPIYTSSLSHSHETKVTTLPNGLKVASQLKYGQYCTVGVVIDSGSRYEAKHHSGISHFLEKLAFNATTEFKDKNSMFQELEKYGGICDCQGNRDTLIYAASAYCNKLDPVISLLSEAILRPKLQTEDIETARQTVQFDLEDMEMRPDQEQLLTDMIHSAAYNQNTLGLPKLCPMDTVHLINRTDLLKYMKQYFAPSRMVVAGVGVEHDDLVTSVTKHFAEKQPIWILEDIKCENANADNSLSQFTGGLVKVEKDMGTVGLGPTPMPELVHFVLGLESSSHLHADFVPFCVLNTMMGGGGSFSAGGPGKGMYTRLYTNVLNRYHWMYSATAYNHAYADSGIFYIHANAPPSQLKELVNVIVNEFRGMIGSISKVELDRAKTQLQSMLLMNLESRPVMFEDMGRQVLATGIRREPEYFIEEIAKVTDEDIYRIASKMLKGKAAVAALGRVGELPSLREIDSALVAKEQSKARRFSLFS